jgi:ABC-type phosphate transport system substrate-binding protein
MRYFNQIITVLLLGLTIISVKAHEPLAVVVNKDNPIDKITRSQLIDLFMGKYVAFPDDSKAMPVELEGEHDIKADFYQNLVGMPLSRVNAYWSRLRFTGRKRDAVFQSTEADLIGYIIANKQAIGYVPQSLITEELKVVYILNE